MDISSLELCCASDSELAAAVVEHSVVIRVTSSEDLQLTSTRPALHRLLMIYKAYDVVVDIWVSIPCTAGTPFKRINEKLGAVTGDLAMTYKLVVATVGLCRNAVRIGGGFSWEWSEGNELWDMVVLRNLFASCGSSSCLVSTAAVGQQFVDREGGEGHCDVVCEGDKKGLCGGMENSSVYSLHDCANTPPTKCRVPPALVPHAKKNHEYGLQQQSNSVQQLKVESW